MSGRAWLRLEANPPGTIYDYILQNINWDDGPGPGEHYSLPFPIHSTQFITQLELTLTSLHFSRKIELEQLESCRMQTDS